MNTRMQLKRGLFFSLLFIPISLFGQKKPSSNDFVDKIIQIWKKVSTLNDEYESSANSIEKNDDAEDSLIKNNTILLSLVNSSDFSNLSYSSLKEIRDSTGLKVILSKDSKLKIISWGIYNDLPEPSYCAVFILPKGKSEIVSSNGTASDDFGNNIQYDTIINFLVKNKTCYLTSGSNKCGNLCIKKTASLYSINDTVLVKSTKAFLYKSQYSEEVSFEYTLGKKTKEPLFIIENKRLVAPVFDKNRLNIIGSKRYQIAGIN